jgi:hypothetical protein
MEPTEQERVLVYAGPSLDHDSIREQVPEAIIKPPLKQGDFISDLMELQPSHVLIIDGTFHQSLSIWHKEVIWALQIPGVKAVYGASSMGALRAADIANFGMIGCGKIFEWYYEGVIHDESEVASTYAPLPDGSLFATTVPLVNVRGALLKGFENEVFDEETAEQIFAQAGAIHWTERTERSLGSLNDVLLDVLKAHNQKAIDALELLCTFRDLKPIEGAIKPTEESLSLLFSAQFERDRSVTVGGRQVKLQDIDAFVSLHSQEFEELSEAADNRILGLLLADIYRIGFTAAELDAEWRRMNIKKGLRSLAEHDRFLRDNHMNARELYRLLGEEIRLRKLRRALMVRCGPRRRTQRLLDLLKLNGQYPYWCNAAARHEQLLESQGGEIGLEFAEEMNVSSLLLQHAKSSGQTISASLEDFIAENGFGTLRELAVALLRDKAGTEG